MLPFRWRSPLRNSNCPGSCWPSLGRGAREERQCRLETVESNIETKSFFSIVFALTFRHEEHRHLHRVPAWHDLLPRRRVAVVNILLAEHAQDDESVRLPRSLGPVVVRVDGQVEGEVDDVGKGDAVLEDEVDRVADGGGGRVEVCGRVGHGDGVVSCVVGLEEEEEDVVGTAKGVKRFGKKCCFMLQLEEHGFKCCISKKRSIEIIGSFKL